MIVRVDVCNCSGDRFDQEVPGIPLDVESIAGEVEFTNKGFGKSGP